MESQAPTDAPLSLQDKLDRISHERRVLAVLRELMRHGLHDGDDVRHRTSGSRGRLIVLRSSDPQPVVLMDDGTQVAFHADDWSRLGA